MRLAALLVSALALGACRQQPARPGLPPRNLLVITVDELRPDRMSCYDNVRPTTWLPKDSTQIVEQRAFDIDELARTGVVFRHAYAPLEKMIPSVVSLFTGHGPRTSGVLEYDKIAAEIVPVTLPEVLAGEGFETVALISHQPPKEGLNLKRLLLEGKFEAYFECADDQETLLRARDWIAERDFGNERPFFLWLHLSGLLPPYRAAPVEDPTSFAPHYAWEEYQGPARRPWEFLVRVKKGELDPTAEDWAYLEARYDEALGELTRELAGLLAELFDYHLPSAELSETWARTLLVLTAPTGTDFQRNQEELGYARDVSEEMLRVPLILRHPDSLTGERVFDEVVELADVMPTVLEWFEIDVPAGVTGRSLLGITDRGRSFASRPAFATKRDSIHTARTERWRMIWDTERLRLHPEPVDTDTLLFDCLHNPYSTVDVAGSHPEVTAELRRELEAWAAIEFPDG